MDKSYNRHSKESRESQYAEYLKTQSHFDRLGEIVRESAEMNAHVFIKQSTIQRATLWETTEKVNSVLSEHFNSTQETLSDIEYGIQGLCNVIEEGFISVVEQQKITNRYLGKIQNLLRIPNSQKQRVYHIERGLTFLKNAIQEGAESDFYEDALEEFQSALAYEKRDYFTLYRIGLIHLTSVKHIDFKQAQDCFEKSGRYCLAEAHVKGTSVSVNLLDDWSKDLVVEASDAFYYAAEACRLQTEYSKAIKHAQKAWDTLPQNAKAGFLLGKCLAVNKQMDEAVVVLEKAIKQKAGIWKVTAKDVELSSINEIESLLDRLHREAREDAFEKFNNCQNLFVDGHQSAAKKFIDSVKERLLIPDYIQVQVAISLLTKDLEWETIEKIAEFEDNGKVIPRISHLKFKGEAFDFIQRESWGMLSLPKAKILIDILGLESELSSAQEQVSKNMQSLGKYLLGLFVLLTVIGGFTALYFHSEFAFSFVMVILVIIVAIALFSGGADLLGLALVLSGMSVFKTIALPIKNAIITKQINRIRTSITAKQKKADDMHPIY